MCVKEWMTLWYYPICKKSIDKHYLNECLISNYSKLSSQANIVYYHLY